MEILELERYQSDLHSFLNEPASNRAKLLRISKFFSLLLSSPNLNLTEVYIASLFSEYLLLLEHIKIRGLSLGNFTFILNQFDKIKDLSFLSGYKVEIEETRILLQKKFEVLSSWLNGSASDNQRGIIYFPVLEKFKSEKDIGFLEIIRVKIIDGENKFIIEPYESENDSQLQKQMHLCWQNAIEYSRKYVRRIKPTHTVELKFENKLGIYIGSSFGIALTLAFIEAILKYYNSKMIVSINGCIAVTGGIDQNYKIISASKEIIETKVETVFYSDAQIFCIPKTDEQWAEEKLKELKTLYPNRDLKIIGLTDLNDLLDRRQIVDIRKQKLVVRTGKFVKKNWISAIATVLLAILFAYLFVMDFDDNPASLYSDGLKLFVKNKSGKVLWTLNVNHDIDILLYAELMRNFAKILDFNNDNENELLFVQTAADERNKKQDRGTIICYDKYQKIKWEYTFQDTVYSERENLQPLYNVYLIDTTTIGNKLAIFCYANNATSYSSAIFALDLRTGERIKNTQWNSGYIWDAMIVDLEEDGEKEVVATGADNGLKAAVIWAMKLKNVNGYRPTTQNYMIKNFDETNLQFYIRIPNTDYDSLSGSRSSGMLPGTLAYDKVGNNIRFSAISTIYPNTGQNINTFHYSLNYKRMDFDIFLIDKFSSKRDSLVAIGRLNKPYTDTKEYKEIIKNSILYFKDGKWVNRKELSKYD